MICYSFGLLSLIASDLMITNMLSATSIADWALFRSLVGISAILPLTGLEQVLVRSPQSSARLLRMLALQIPLIGLLVGLLLDLAGIVEHWWIGAGLAIGSAVSLMLFHYYRSHHLRVLSQISQQGWKIAALVVVSLLITTGARADLVLCGVILLFLADVVAGSFLIRHPPSKLHMQEPEPTGALYSVGLRFMVTGLFLSLSVYAEQIVVHRLGNVNQAALYFTSVTYFLFPMSFLNGYISFLIGPWVRDNEEKFMILLRANRIILPLGIILYSITLNFLGWLAWKVTSPAIGAPDQLLQFLFIFVCGFRTLYLIPAGYIGALTHPHAHNVFIFLQLTGLVLAVLVFIELQSIGMELIYAVALSSALNWALRLSAALVVMRIISRQRMGQIFA